MKYSALILFLFLSATSFAQTTAPVGNDSTYRSGRSLPPSMLQELRRSQKSRTLIYTDTVHASDLERAHFNDSIDQQYSDSAISMIDTAVSLPHKEWLDSELVEIPELERTGSHAHYYYPTSMVMETDLHPVRFDSSLVQYMNPVTRENLPYFDQSPMPQPLTEAQKSETFLEMGGGNVLLPRVDGWLAQSLSERSALYANGNFEAFQPSQDAIHSALNLVARLDAEFGKDPAEAAVHSDDVSIEGGYNARSIAITNLLQNGRTVSDLFGRASIEGDASRDFHYYATLDAHDWNDNVNAGTSEGTFDAVLGAGWAVGDIHLDAAGNYSSAAMSGDTGATGPLYGTLTTAIDAESAQLTVGNVNERDVMWDAGAEYLGGMGVDGSSYASILPLARLRLQMNARWDLGASFEPQVQLASARMLSGINPFYSPAIVLQYRANNSAFLAPVDARSVMMDKINLAAFMNYALSPDDELHLEARYITRDREPIFEQKTQNDSATVFAVTPESTERLEFTAAGNFLLFAHDVLTASARISSAMLVSGGTIPFEPTSKLDAEYRFNSIWDNIQPSIAVQSISRSGASFFFLDLNANVEFTKRIEGKITLENILDGASDFWPGYPEQPRSIWASVRYIF